MFLRVFALLILCLAAASPAMAFKISQKMTISQLQSACATAGGEFSNDSGVFGTCTKKNCDGKGGACTVVCDDKSVCVGNTPDALHGGQTLVSILQNGDPVLHDIDPTPTGSLSSPSDGSTASPGKPAPPDFELL